ncbi:tagaturonate epimerase family protein [Mariniblastus fucicola]|nr:tagaturonate epimerase family protein [Mariniblastus fucicola]
MEVLVHASGQRFTKKLLSTLTGKSPMRLIEKFSFGVGDRFTLQAAAQLAAVMKINEHGFDVVPVWNKSNREHLTIGTEPQSIRDAADAACEKLGYSGFHYVDADHINLSTVDRFLPCSDFFTLDVADAIGSPCSEEEIEAFISANEKLIGTHEIEGIPDAVVITRESMEAAAKQFLKAVLSTAEIYQYIKSKKGDEDFITEVSMDETDSPQTPVELLIILAALAQHNIPLQTVAPKFTGRFNKGVDYVGDVEQFEREFSDDLAVIAFAVKEFGLPENLKLSVHSGSDKFSIYQPIRRCLEKTGAGLHIKTAGTTWLEEIIGLAEAGGDGLELAKDVYAQAYEKRAALCEPYATVIDIDESKLPLPAEVNGWDSAKFVSTVRHIPDDPNFNSSVRQLLHVGYKIAALKGDEYLNMLKKYEEVVSRNVTENLFDRHLKPLFLGEA